MSATAARNNASWCDTVCRAHGLVGTTFAADAWTSASRTPEYFPDAVTLVPEADVLDRVDTGPGCSIKDSFAALDLAGFEILFEAQWFTAEPSEGAPELQWQRKPGPFDDEDTAQMVGKDGGGAVVAGAVFHRTGRVVGVANVVGSYADLRTVAGRLWPGVEEVVGYEREPALALAAGFQVSGPLRVWLRPPSPPAAAPP